MNPVDYKSFLEQKERAKNGSDEQPVIEAKNAPLLIPPRKKKSALGQPIFIGAVIFLLLISAIGVYSLSGTNKNQKKNGHVAIPSRASTGKLKPIFVDSDFSIYNEKVDTWTPKKEGEIPFGIKILTGNDSRRNIFAIPGSAHSVRTDSDTKFMFESSEETTNFKQRVKLVLEEGRMWIEGGGDIFEVTTPRGVIKGDGNDFEIVLKNDNAHIYSWNGKLSFMPKKDPEKEIYIDKGKMLFIDKAGNIIPPPPDLLSIRRLKTDWQKWNLLIKSENLLGASPIVLPIPKKLAREKALEEMPVGIEKESAKAPMHIKQMSPAKQPKSSAKQPVFPPKHPTSTHKQSAHKPAKAPQAHRPPTNNRGEMINTHSGSSAPFQPPMPPGVGTNDGKAQDPPPPPGYKGKPTPQPTEKMQNVHSDGKEGSGGQPPSRYEGGSSSDQSDSKKSGRSILDNEARKKATTGPPGYGLNEPPVGPSEK
ncbi:MAG: FecR family protein [Candidatus Eremiobacteraeota bacterium]|nr:FecR family protein [Candidatus Eremiobacteraeota bacterium]